MTDGTRSAPVSGETPMAPVTLRFHDPALEREFREGFLLSGRRTIRATLGLVIGLFVGYLALDLAITPEAIGFVLIVRGVVIAVLIAALLFTWHRAFPRIGPHVLGVVGLAATWAMLALMIAMPGSYRGIYHPGVGLVVLATFTMFRHHWPVALAYSALYVASYFLAAAMVGIERDVLLAAAFFLASSVLLGVVAGWAIERYARKEFVGRRALEAERARSERLLRNVLPDSVAERLKSEPGPIADAFPGVAVLFADIVDFSGLSSRLSPNELVAWLNEVFTAFDRIAAAAGVEKIKTIGDAYMAVAGVPEPIDDPCGRMMEVAAAMLDESRRRTEVGGPPLHLRIGVACGPVVAGVIGESKFAYDLWGDPVTLASRMQTHGVAGRIHVTGAVVEALEGRWSFEPRGEIEVKGHGPMATWLADASSREGG